MKVSPFGYMRLIHGMRIQRINFHYLVCWPIFVLVLFSHSICHSEQSDWLNYKGRVQVDYDNTQLNGDEVTDKSAYRRAWFTLYGNGSGDASEGSALQNWAYLARFDLRADEFNDDAVVDLVATYTGLGSGRKITLGRQKTQFGMNWITGNTALTFAERGGVANFHKLGRMEGATYEGDFGGNYNYWVGVYDKEGFDGSATVGRVTYSHQMQAGQYVHLGTGVALTGENNLANIEVAFGLNAFHVQSEYFIAKNDDANTEDTSGFYIEGGYFLDGHSARPYKSGKYGRFKPSGKFGALQMIARFEQGDGNFNHVELGKVVEATSYSLGLNWFLNSNIAFMLSYISAEQKELPGDDGQELRLRGQLVF